MIRAPYNFVPVSEKVFFPGNDYQISHDVPFKDGESGAITIKVEAHSPIYVRNGQKQNEEDVSFSKDSDGKYFIPGTSIKGMIRSVLEIISFGKIGKVNKWIPTYRDLTKEGEAYKNEMKNVRCGWLTSTNSSDSGYEIIDCGEPKRISHKEIDNKFITEFESKFKYETALPNKKLNDNQKIASYKYDLVSKNNKWSRDTLYFFKKSQKNSESLSGNEHNSEMQANKIEYSCEFANDNDHDFKAHIVFTGQPDLRKVSGSNGKPSGKYLEFLFVNNDEDKNSRIPLSNETFKNFLFAYYDNDPLNESKDWRYWKEFLYKGDKIPIFFKKSGTTILHFGLSYLYKLPYAYGIDTAIDNLGKNHKVSNFDLAEAMFGTEQNNNSLKGRVQFSIAKSTNACKELPKQEVVLGSPKVSYFPTYINSAKGYGSSNLQIKGRKRYPVHNTNDVVPNIGTETVSTRFKPLAKGAEFKFVIRYHNLRKVELGALLTALTLNDVNSKEDLFHSIGMGKPLGYGKIKLKVESINSDILNLNNVCEYMEVFFKRIESVLNITWNAEAAIIELLTMAKRHENSSKLLCYMNLAVGGANEFVDAKNDEESLPLYSTLDGVEPVCFCSVEEWEGILNGYIEQKNIDDLKIKLKDFKDYDECKTALEQLLTKLDYSKDYDELYMKFPKSPSIIYKLLVNNTLGDLDVFLKRHLKLHLDKKDPVTQKIFLYIFKHKHNNKVPNEGFTGAIKFVKYLWEDVEITEDLICDLSSHVWPPVKELRSYLDQSQLVDKKDLLDLLDMELEDMGLL